MEKINDVIEKIADEIMPQYPDISWDDCREKVIEGIKAGAEWMARQMKQEQPEVDLDKEIEEHVYSMPHCEFSHYTEDLEDEDWARAEFRHFYELGLNARKEE